MNLKKTVAFSLLCILCNQGRMNAQKNFFNNDKVTTSFYAQFWLRNTDMNPGTVINGEEVSRKTDLSIRRLRMSMGVDITDKLYAYMILGGNSYNTKNDKTFPFGILDLYTEYRASEYFQIGVGKSGFQGLSRWNIRSASTLMALDAPLFTLNTVNKNDDLGRSLGVWMKGQAAKFDYRLVLNQPFQVTKTSENGVDFATNNPKLKWSTYVKYMFLDSESNKSAYSAGSYLSAKKVLNLGGGYMAQKDAMQNSVNGVAQEYYDMKHWAVDLYYNSPLRHGSDQSITTYFGYFSYDYGPDYIRNVAADNIATSSTADASFNGSGDGFPMMGTGDTFFLQFGYAFPVKIDGKNRPVQPNIAIQHSKWEKLDDPMIVYDLGVNLYLNGKKSKLTLGYQYRPIFYEGENGEITQEDYKGMTVLQYQIGF
ncbi:MAG: porin [Flavobacteriaceae bacterium]